MPDIFVTKPSMPTYEEYCDEIKDLWNSKWITNFGSKYHEFEDKLKDYLNCSNISLFVNGHLALETLIKAYNFEKGSEIITTPFTFISTTLAITNNGLTPVFCDIDENDFTIDDTKIEELITDKTVAILPVHVYGNIAHIKEIEEIAKRHNLKVIYDAAHAFGIKYKNRSLCTYGDASILSFHATKVFNSIEGGAVITNDTDLLNKLNAMKDFGIVDEETVNYSGTNAKMNEFQSAMGICNLKYIDNNIARRHEIYDSYISLLGNTQDIRLNVIKEDVFSNYAYFPVIFNTNHVRDKVYQVLKDNGIHARKYFYPLISDMEPYKNYKGNTKIAKDISSRVLTLPIYPELTNQDTDRISRIIIDCLK